MVTRLKTFSMYQLTELYANCTDPASTAPSGFCDTAASCHEQFAPRLDAAVQPIGQMLLVPTPERVSGRTLAPS